MGSVRRERPSVHGSIRVGFTEEVTPRGLSTNSPSEQDWGCISFLSLCDKLPLCSGLKQTNKKTPHLLSHGCCGSGWLHGLVCFSARGHTKIY